MFKYLSLILSLCLITAVFQACQEKEPKQPPRSIDELFKAYYQAPEFSTLQSNEHVLWQAASAWYNNGDYGAAANAIKDGMKDSTFTRSKAEAGFYLGVCDVMLARDLVSMVQGKKRDEEAIRLFSQLDKEDPHFHDGQWGVVMAHLRMGRVAEARKTLKEVKRNDPGRKESAEALLEELKRLPDTIDLQEKQ